MSVAPGEAAAVRLLAAIADPAVIVDASGFVMGWNDAAAVLLGISEDPPDRSLGAIAADRADDAARLALVDAGGAALLAWRLDEPGLSPDDIALEKMDIIGRIAGGVRHDLMNPLSAIMGFSELHATDTRLPRDLRELATDVIEAGQRVQLMVHTMLEFSRWDRSEPKVLALGPMVRELLSLLAHAMTDVTLRVTIPDTLPEVEADRAHLRQAILAILINALEAQGTTWARGAKPVSGRLTVSARAVDDARGKRVRMWVENGGPELPADMREALSGRGGAGAGPGARSGLPGRDLAVARALVEEAGGRLSYEAVAGGNRIVVELPVAGAPPVAELPAPGASQAIEAGAGHVLVCDADPAIRTLLVRFVTRAGAKAIEARDGREALAILADQRVVLVLADVGIDAGGAELYEQTIALRPHLADRFVLLSGDPGNASLAEFTGRTGVPVVPKPFDNDLLGQLVRDAIVG